MFPVSILEKYAAPFDPANHYMVKGPGLSNLAWRGMTSDYHNFKNKQILKLMILSNVPLYVPLYL